MKRILSIVIMVIAAVLSVMSISGCEKQDARGTVVVRVSDTSSGHFVSVLPYVSNPKPYLYVACASMKVGQSSVSLRVAPGNYIVSVDGNMAAVQVFLGEESFVNF